MGASSGAYTAPATIAPMQSFTQAASFAPLQSFTKAASFAPLRTGFLNQATSVAPMRTGYMNSIGEMGSAGNPYNKLNLGAGKLIGRTAGKNMGARQVMLGEKHVVHNDLKVLENHEADKVIFTKKVIHHSPVLHKTIRTHEIAEDAVHE